MEMAATHLDLPCTSHHVEYRVTEINQFRRIRGWLSSRTLPFQLRICITLKYFNQYAGIITDGATVFYDPTPDPFRPPEEVQYVFDASFTGDNLIYPHISEMLYCLGIEEEERGTMVVEICLAAIDMMNRPSNMGCNVFRRLDVTVRRTRVHTVDERILVSRALGDSAREFEEERRNGMIPAAESAMETMLKNVMVQRKKSQEEGHSESGSGTDDDESCTICLEDLSQGSTALKMPCSHVFHSDCIRKWLEQSHYCPLCRFEMPTSLDN